MLSLVLSTSITLCFCYLQLEECWVKHLFTPCSEPSRTKSSGPPSLVSCSTYWIPSKEITQRGLTKLWELDNLNYSLHFLWPNFSKSCFAPSISLYSKCQFILLCIQSSCSLACSRLVSNIVTGILDQNRFSRTSDMKSESWGKGLEAAHYRAALQSVLAACWLLTPRFCSRKL